MKPIDLYTHKKVEDTKPKAPPAVTAAKAGLHPMSKTVQGLVGNNTKKK